MSDSVAHDDALVPAARGATLTEEPRAGVSRQQALAEERTLQADVVRACKDECDGAESALSTAPPWLHWVMTLRLAWSRNRLARAKNSAAAHRTIK